MPRPSLVAMMATCRRAELLVNRALPSIADQTRLADEIFVIEDGASTGLASRLKTVNPVAKLLRNRRTVGALGSPQYWSGSAGAKIYPSRSGLRGLP